ncbi:MAG: alcohol dehydrogenase [SAR116 cluster bacterium]|nr:alcohol dehydrogenase [Paracoccaceae bacterium]RCL78749.1 MAG: alcohol dehydrogenase [SAR116 cluster bacterium]HBQ22607.1 alcohol dehydrogenase [Alphaproteobacteria bacterium]HCJ61230.1 alcohol dehydrogenase [Alphaproteobacteria bacterium]|tara:strand:+ start:1214 stop:2347 length:1134 start_codon:yes stop_codon:yes gene_type:complete
MSIKSRAVVIRECGVPGPYAERKLLSVEEVTLLPPLANELVVKIAGAGLCHSDLSVMNATRPRPMPMVLGHEGAGVVEEVGPSVTDIQVGDHVVFQFSASCGRCRSCLEGRPQICSTHRKATATNELMGGGSRIRDAEGNVLGHHTGVSCFSEYAVVDRGSVVVVDPTIPLADAALFGCAVMTGVGAATNTARIRTGDSVAVIGLGGVGLNGVMGAKVAGADQVIGIDIDERKLAKAIDVGATHSFVANDPDLLEKVRDLTSGGVDFAIELAGAIGAMRTAYNLVRRGGSVVTAGLSPAGQDFSFEHATLVAEEKSILGSYMGSCVPVRDIPRFISLQQQGRLPVEKLVDEHITFDQINEAFDRLDRGEVVRQILVP